MNRCFKKKEACQETRQALTNIIRLDKKIRGSTIDNALVCTSADDRRILLFGYISLDAHRRHTKNCAVFYLLLLWPRFNHFISVADDLFSCSFYFLLLVCVCDGAHGRREKPSTLNSADDLWRCASLFFYILHRREEKRWATRHSLMSASSSSSSSRRRDEVERSGPCCCCSSSHLCQQNHLPSKKKVISSLRSLHISCARSVWENGKIRNRRRRRIFLVKSRCCVLWCYNILSSSISLLRVARLLLSDDKGGRLVANATKELRLPLSSSFFFFNKIW